MAQVANIEPEIGSPEWTKVWLAKRKAQRVSKANSLKVLGAYFKELGYRYIRVWYEGSGDSGDCYEAEGWKGKINLKSKNKDNTWPDVYQSKAYNHNKEENFDKWKDMTRNQKQLQKEYSIFLEQHPDNNLEKELEWELVELVDYDWYNNEGGQGELVWDLKKETFNVKGEQNTYSCYDVKETYFMDGREPETEYGQEIHER